jgi:hypothetical protein
MIAWPIALMFCIENGKSPLFLGCLNPKAESSTVIVLMFLDN